MRTAMVGILARLQPGTGRIACAITAENCDGWNPGAASTGRRQDCLCYCEAMAEEKGLLIVYTGPGKGKTTCALGAAFRAVGQGLRVLMVQFIKGSWHYGELDTAKMLGDDKMEIRAMGRGFVKMGGAETDPEDVRLCEQAWEYGREQIYSEQYDL